ncbi:MAG: potassium channel family protein [Solirubrobacteraceae bacterium]
MYWAITTMTTVGSGITAKTSEGKAITVAVIFVGIGFAALVIGAAADRFVNRRGQKAESTEDALLAHVKDLSAEVQRLERTLQQRQSA